MTKRQVQLTGTRKWWGNQLQQMQDNIYEHLENLFLRHATGALIIKQPSFDSSHNITDVGYILMNGADGFRICEISGSYYGNNGETFYITQDFVSVDTDTYTDSGTIKDISRKYIAKDEGATAPATPYVKVDAYEFFDDQGNQIQQFQYWLEGQFYTKSNANDNAYNTIDASFLRGSVGYTKAEADDHAYNTIDANTAKTADNVLTLNNKSHNPFHSVLENMTYRTISYSAFGNNTEGYLVTVYAKLDNGASSAITTNALPSVLRPSVSVHQKIDTDSGDSFIEVQSNGIVRSLNGAYSAQIIVSATYHTNN